jgi:small subunit ribosomal protein S19
MSRSLKKGPYLDENLMKKVKKALDSGNRKPIKTWARASTITPEMVGLTFAIHNGKTHEDVLIVESMIGHKLGEFAPTRKFKGHAKKGKLAKVYGSSGRFEE